MCFPTAPLSILLVSQKSFSLLVWPIAFQNWNLTCTQYCPTSSPSDRELQVMLRNVALVLVVELVFVLRHMLSGCAHTCVVDLLYSHNNRWSESWKSVVALLLNHFRDLEQFLSSESPIPRFYSVMLGLCALFFSLSCLCSLDWIISTACLQGHWVFCVLSSLLRCFKISIYFLYYFSYCPFSFGTSIWFFFLDFGSSRRWSSFIHAHFVVLGTRL